MVSTYVHAGDVGSPTPAFLPEERAYLDRFTDELGWVDVGRTFAGDLLTAKRSLADTGVGGGEMALNELPDAAIAELVMLR